jgi:fused signal recognition particle receptor
MTDSDGGGSWLSRLRAGLTRTSSGISSAVTGIFTHRRLDEAMLRELEDALILADVGAGVASRIVASFGKERFGKEISPEEVKETLAASLAAIVQPVALPLAFPATGFPAVVLVVGVNGNGKTTTIGKLAAWLHSEGKTVMLAACDTFRAAAVEQLRVWGERAGVEVVTAEERADPASVAYRALEQARAAGTDVLLMDTAGRLHNKKNLMEELQKICRVLKKLDADAPQHIVQVVDGTTGQNALAQVAAFRELIGVTGLVVTKLDGTAKGGVVVALAEQFGLPIHAVGVGEGLHDLRPFAAAAFARSLVGA